MTETVVLVAGGPMDAAESGHLRDAVASAALVVGVDGGARHLLALGIVPQVVTGDFDSLTEAERRDLAARGTEIVATPDQNFTDLDKALVYVTETHRARSIRVYAGTGGRLDHIYSVLSAVVKHGRGGIDLRLVDAVGETWRIDGAATLSGADLPGRVLSLMALGPVDGVWTTGVRWPLSGDALAPGVRDGTLNEIVAETVTIRVGSGDLLAQLHHADRPR